MPTEASTVTSLPVEHLFTVHLDVGDPTYIKDGPEGTKLIVGILGGTVAGEKINGVVMPHTAGDWVSIGPKGDMRIDVRLTVMTDDGAAIYMSYKGILTGGKALCSPLFETGAEQYAWVNQKLGIGVGTASSEGVDYEFYALA